MKGFYEMSETIKSYKGFDKDLKCRGFQYEIGKEYEEPEADVCRAGFHACERPLDVFNHYCPVNSRFCEVEQSGELSRDTDDSKVASTKIKIGAEIGIPGLVKAQIEWVKAHTTTEHTDPEREQQQAIVELQQQAIVELQQQAIVELQQRAIVELQQQTIMELQQQAIVELQQQAIVELQQREEKRP
nr:MAG TPA: hypothetical protein [Caudoviricetes sp.]